MDMDIEEVAAIVDRELEAICTRFRDQPASILTEDDLKCWLFSRLVPTFGDSEPTRDPNILCPPLHAELSWFDNNGDLRHRPDITILQPQHLSIRRGVVAGIPLPSKGAHFIGSAVLVEFKVSHQRGGVSPQMVMDFAYDVEKLKEISERHYDSGARILGRCILLSRYAHNSNELRTLVEANNNGNIRVQVVTSNLQNDGTLGNGHRDPPLREIIED